MTTEHWLAVAIGFFWLQVLICYFTYKRGFGDGFLKGWMTMKRNDLEQMRMEEEE